MRLYHAAPPLLKTTPLLIGSLALLVVPGLRAAAQGQAQSAAGGVVIDHDPMGMTVGSPAPMVTAAPGPHPHPPVREVVPNPAFNQILVGRLTPISVATGNRTPTSEQLRLECCVGQRQGNGTILMQRLREGQGVDYYLERETAPIVNGKARFLIAFGRSVLSAGHRSLSARTVYLVTSKVVQGRGNGEAGNILTVTVLNDDPAAFPGGVAKE